MLVPTLLEMVLKNKRAVHSPDDYGRDAVVSGLFGTRAGNGQRLSTAAVLDGDEWVINGQKIWTSTAQIADWIFCLVRSEPDAKHKGISFCCLT